MDIRKIDIKKLNMTEYNPRKDLQPGDTEYEKLKRSINEFGYIDPIIWNETTGNIVGGHQRLKILIEQGYKEVDVSVVSLDKTKEKALNIALNKIEGEWDYNSLEELMKELSFTELDLTLTGFNQSEINKMISEDINNITGNIEIDTDEFEDEEFNCKCPKCGFMFNSGDC